MGVECPFYRYPVRGTVRRGDADMLKEVVLLGIGAISFINRVDKVQSASRDSRSENIVVHPAIVAELDLDRKSTRLNSSH